MQKIFVIIIICFSFSCKNNPNKTLDEFEIQIGDILFQDLDSSPLCDAIELVTPGFRNANFSHIGIIISKEKDDLINYNCLQEIGDTIGRIRKTRVLEAIPTSVKTTSIDSFLRRSLDNNKKPKVVVGRLKDKYKYAIPSAVKFLTSKIGKEYDDEFLLENEKYYCSELIYEAFKKDTIFQLNNMTFLHPETKDTINIWKEYYKSLGIKIPENELGINPGIMSLSDKIDIVHIYGTPDGMNKE